MKGKRRLLMGLSLLAIGLVAFMALGPGSARAGATNYGYKLWITDDYLSGQALFSDGKGWYIDRLLENGDNCVRAWVSANSLFFINMDLNADCPDCNLSGCAGDKGPRTYTLIFPVGSEACSKLGLDTNTCSLKIDPNFGKPRIRAEKLFSKKTTTPVAFLFRITKEDGSYDSYEVRTDQEVYFTVLGSERTLTYGGTARLWRINTEFDKHVFGPVTSPFMFPFQLKVERVPQ